MTRRELLKSTVAAAAASAALTLPAAVARAATPQTRKFKLKYAPHFGMFKEHAGKDPIDQLKFMADQGFTAMEDNGMMGRSVEEQERIAREMSRLNMTMGVFVAFVDWGQPTLTLDKPEIRSMLVQQMKQAVEVGKRVNARWATLVPGLCQPRLDFGYQTSNVVDNLKACAEICEPAGLVLVLEPLNFRDHPNLFLTKVSQAFEICRAVGSPSCKILDDLYHQQVSEGNLIPNIDAAWDEIAYFQLGDNPGRCEPTTGEINYRNVFRHIHEKGFTGIIGMEHGNSRPGREGEQAVIDAYATCDDF